MLILINTIYPKSTINKKAVQYIVYENATVVLQQDTEMLEGNNLLFQKLAGEPIFRLPHLVRMKFCSGVSGQCVRVIGHS